MRSGAEKAQALRQLAIIVELLEQLVDEQQVPALQERLRLSALHILRTLMELTEQERE